MRWRTAIVAGMATSFAACAGDPGVGWGSIELDLRATWTVPDDRRADGDEVMLAGGWLVTIEAVEWTLGGAELAIEEEAATGTGDTFDPADPPAGYANCHGGHCHADDGRLVSYEEIAAEMAAGGGTTRRVLARFAGAGLPSDPNAPSRLLPCADSCLLVEDAPSWLILEPTALRIRGRVRDGRATPRLDGTAAFEIDLPLTGLVLESPLAWPARPDDAAPTWRVEARLELGPAILDSIDWSAASGDPLRPDEIDLEDLAAWVATLDPPTAEVRHD